MSIFHQTHHLHCACATFHLPHIHSYHTHTTHFTQTDTGAYKYPDPRTGEPINFNFLPTYADAGLGVMPHTVQVCVVCVCVALPILSVPFIYVLL